MFVVRCKFSESAIFSSCYFHPLHCTESGHGYHDLTDHEDVLSVLEENIVGQLFVGVFLFQHTEIKVLGFDDSWMKIVMCRLVSQLLEDRMFSPKVDLFKRPLMSTDMLRR